MKIIATTKTLAFTGIDSDDHFIEVPSEVLRGLDGRVYDEETMSDYLAEEVLALGVSGGNIALKFCDDYMGILAVTEFECVRLLSTEELSLLKNEYDGQMSDGMGSNFFGDIMDEVECDFQVRWLYYNGDEDGSTLIHA